MNKINILFLLTILLIGTGVIIVAISISNDKSNPRIEEYNCEELQEFVLKDEGIPRSCGSIKCYACDNECVFRQYTVKCLQNNMVTNK